MIKAEVSVVGTVMQAVQLKQSQQGSRFYSVTIETEVAQKEGGVRKVLIGVTAPMESPVGVERLVNVGQRVTLSGTLHFRKVQENLYMNMSAKAAAPVEETIPMGISGTLEMLGKLGSKMPEVRQGKNNKSFMNFSAFSGEGEGEARTYIWVRFVRFASEVEPFFLPKALLSIKGTLELQYFKDSLSISCRVSEVAPYQKTEKEAPF